MQSHSHSLISFLVSKIFLRGKEIVCFFPSKQNEIKYIKTFFFFFCKERHNFSGWLTFYREKGGNFILTSFFSRSHPSWHIVIIFFFLFVVRPYSTICIKFLLHMVFFYVRVDKTVDLYIYKKKKVSICLLKNMKN